MYNSGLSTRIGEIGESEREQQPPHLLRWDPEQLPTDVVGKRVDQHYRYLRVSRERYREKRPSHASGTREQVVHLSDGEFNPCRSPYNKGSVTCRGLNVCLSLLLLFL